MAYETKIIEYLGLDQEGFDLSSYREGLKQKTLKGTLTLRDAMFISFDTKGLKILEKSFVQNPDAERLSQVFPQRHKIPSVDGGTIHTSPEPKSAISNWSSLIGKIKNKTNKSIEEILDSPFDSYIVEGISEDLDMGSSKGGSSALRQGIFYIRNQKGLTVEERESVFFGGETSKRLLGGSEVFSQTRDKGQALGTRLLNSRAAPSVAQAVKRGMSVITDPDIKAAIMYNTLIPHRTVQVSRLRLSPETDSKGSILKDATDPYLDGDRIIVPEAGQKMGQKRYTSIQLTPFMQDFLNQHAKNHPDREFLFRDNNVTHEQFSRKVNAAINLEGGIAQQTQEMVKEGKFTSAIKSFKFLRKLSATMINATVPGSFDNLKHMMGHSSDNDVTKETGITRGAYIGSVIPAEGKTDIEVSALFEDEFQKGSGASSKRELLKSVFNISEVELSDNFVETPLEAQIAGKTSSQSFIDRQVFAATLDNDPELSQSAKENLLERFGDKPNSIQLLENYRKEIDSSYSAYKEAVEKVGGAVVDEDQYFDQVASGKIESSSVETSLPSVTEPEKTPSVKTSKVVEETEAPLEKTPFEFTDTSGNEPLTEREKSRRASDTLKKLKEGTLNLVQKKLPLKLGIGALTGGASFGIDVAEAALASGPAGWADDPAERIPPTSDISDKELFQKMQDAASQRHYRLRGPQHVESRGIAERTMALAEIDKHRKDFSARAFDAPSQMKAREAELTELDYTTPELERMRLAKTLQDVDTSEVHTEEARDARIQAQMDAALRFNQQ